MIPSFDQIKQEGKLLENSKETENSEVLQKRLDDLVDNWDEVFQSIVKYNYKLTNVLPVEKDYHYTLIKLLSWVDNAERKMNELQSDSLKTDQKNMVSYKIKEFELEVNKYSPVHKEYNTIAEDLFNRCINVDVTADVPFVKDEVHQTNGRWDILMTSIEKINRNEVSLEKAMGNLKKSIDVVEEIIEGIEEVVSQETPVSFDLYFHEQMLADQDAALESMKDKEVYVRDINKSSDQISNFIVKCGGDNTDISKKSADIQRTWSASKNKLTDKQEKSRTQLKQISQLAKSASSLDDWVNIIATTVPNLHSADATPEDMKKHLDQVEAIQEEIPKQNIELQMCEEVGEWLCDEFKEQPRFCTEIQNKLAKIKYPVEEISSVLSNQETDIYTKLVNDQEFDNAVEDVIYQIDKLSSKLSLQKPISVEWKTLKLQNDKQHLIKKKVTSLTHMCEKLKEVGEQVIKEAEESCEHDSLEEKMNDAMKQFDEIVENSSCRSAKLEKVIDKSKTFYDMSEDLNDWLDKQEKIVTELNAVPMTMEDVSDLEHQIETLLNNINNEEPIYENTRESLRDLVNTSNAEEVTQNVQEVEKVMERICERWTNLRKIVESRGVCVEKYKSLICSFNNAIQPLEDCLLEFEEHLNKRPVFGTDSKKVEDELERIKELIDKLQTQEGSLKSVGKISLELITMIEDEEKDAGIIKNHSVNIGDRFKNIKLCLHHKSNELEKVYRVCTQFTVITNEINEWCDLSNQAVKMLVPAGKEAEKAKNQIQNMEVSNLQLQYTSAISNSQGTRNFVRNSESSN